MVDDGRTDGRRTDGRTPDHGHPISSPCEPDGSGELKTNNQFDNHDITGLSFLHKGRGFKSFSDCPRHRCPDRR